ncbi:MAG TPA: cytochrome P450 [Amycolatopsis sp.]|uniref:cytochrome P450 n=1 Tax=Amycolatopsis sp. TaxID=37632 RepID=UPI002B4649FE|nr:cytochrome P450 [Amycolatopsis sp.]HKS49401.1 cytochrome P450 [Amycolatopsis sp.]
MAFPEPDVTVVSGRKACAEALRNLSSNPSPEPQTANLLFMDGQAHSRLRMVVRRIIAGLEPLSGPLLGQIESLVAELAERDEFDLAADFARPVAAAVMAALLGARQPITGAVLADIEAVTSNLDVWFGTAGADTAAFRLATFFVRAEPVPGGGLSVLREAATTGEITGDQALVTPVMLAHAAYENSLNFLALAGLRLATDAELATGLRKTPPMPIVRRLADEIAPARLVMRRAAEPTELPGLAVPAGRKVAVRLGPGMGPAFGLGPHACPGTAIALAEAETALPALARALSGEHTVQDVRWKGHPVFHGLERAVVVQRGQ